MLGDQTIVRDVVGDKGWSSIVPMRISNTGRDDLLFYNATNGRAAYAVTTSDKAAQTIVRDVVGDKGWSSIVPMRSGNTGRDDLLFYNATTGRAAYAVTASDKAAQTIVRDVVGDKGWISIVPMRIGNTGRDDLLFYNATTGRAAYAVTTSDKAAQTIVRDVIGDKGWTSIVPMRIGNTGRDDLLFYNATTGRAAYAVTTSDKAAQTIVRDVVGDKGWTSIVPMNIDPVFNANTNLLFYNSASGRAAYAVTTSDKAAQTIIRDVVGDKGWTSIVPMNIDPVFNGNTDLLFYNSGSGRAVYSIDPNPDPKKVAANAIEQKYQQIGARQSLLGRSVVSNPNVQPDGLTWVRNFAGGQIKFTSEAGASAFVTHRTVVRFRGIHAFGISEATDEPYAIVGVYASDARDKIVVRKFPVGRDSYTGFKPGTDASESEEISLEWAPQTLVIVSTVMEHDSGDPDRVAAKVEDSLKKAAIDAGADPAEVSVFTGILDDLGIPGLIADVLGVGDDLIGIQTLQLNSTDLTPKRPMQQFGNISFNFESPLLSDGDASYKLFYEVFFQEIPVPKQL